MQSNSDKNATTAASVLISLEGNRLAVSSCIPFSFFGGRGALNISLQKLLPTFTKIKLIVVGILKERWLRKISDLTQLPCKITGGY